MLRMCVALFLIAFTLLPATRADDPVAAQLAKDRDKFVADRERLAKLVADALDTALNDARSAGDQDALARLAADRDLFESDGVLPASVERAARQYADGLKQARAAMKRALERAADGYKKSAQYDAEKTARAEAEEFAAGDDNDDDGPIFGLTGAVPLSGRRWKRDGTALVADVGKRDVLGIPFNPRGEYALEMLVARTQGKGDLQLGFCTGSSNALLILDGMGGGRSGLTLIDGKEAEGNGTAHNGTLFKDAKPIRVELTARTGAVQVTVDDAKIITWEGKPESIALPEGLKSVQQPLFLVASEGTAFRIEALRVRELPKKKAPKAAKAQAKNARPAPGASPQADPLPKGRRFVGKNGTQGCDVEIVESSATAVAIRITNGNGAIWRLDCARRGNQLTITEIRQMKNAVPGHARARVANPSGGGTISGNRLEVRYLCNVSWVGGVQNQPVNNLLAVTAN